MKKYLTLLFLLPSVVKADIVAPDPGYGYSTGGNDDVAIIFVIGVIIAIIVGVVLSLKKNKKK